jgi:hypothetical protein
VSRGCVKAELYKASRRLIEIWVVPALPVRSWVVKRVLPNLPD